MGGGGSGGGGEGWGRWRWRRWCSVMHVVLYNAGVLSDLIVSTVGLEWRGEEWIGVRVLRVG